MARMRPEDYAAARLLLNKEVIYLDMLTNSMHHVRKSADDPLQSLENLRDCLANHATRISNFLDEYRR